MKGFYILIGITVAFSIISIIGLTRGGEKCGRKKTRE